MKFLIVEPCQLPSILIFKFLERTLEDNSVWLLLLFFFIISSCTRKIQVRNAMAKEAFNRIKLLYEAKHGTQGEIKCYVRNIVLYDWTLKKLE